MRIMASLADKGKALFANATAEQNTEHEQLTALGASDYEARRLIDLNGPSLIQEMFKACEKGWSKKVSRLIVVGAILDEMKDGSTGLHVCGWNGQNECIKVLVDKGATVDIPDKAGFKGTALHWAAENGHVETCQLLISLGASKDAKTEHGLTAKQVAQKWKQDACEAVL